MNIAVVPKKLLSDEPVLSSSFQKEMTEVIFSPATPSILLIIPLQVVSEFHVRAEMTCIPASFSSYQAPAVLAFFSIAICVLAYSKTSLLSHVSLAH